MATTTDDLSLERLEQIPDLALQFLRATGTTPAIRSLLIEHGYTQEEHDLGWSLLHGASGYASGKSQTGPGIAVDPVVRDAINELDNWDEPNFARIEATLQRSHGPQAQFLFDNLSPAQGAAAVVSVETLLDRLDALEKGTGRKGTHKEDLAAIALLETRRYTKAVRAHLRGLIATAKKGTAMETAPVDARAGQEHQTALKALYAWHKDWATTARATIKRRDYLIRLGLAKRKAPVKKEAAVPKA